MMKDNYRFRSATWN